MTNIALENPKKIVFLRHGHALSSIEANVDYDSRRPLSSQGMEEVKISAKKLARLNIHFDIILTSPYERAENTAKIIFEALKVTILADENLSSGVPESRIWQFIVEKLNKYNNIIVVGHQPCLGTIAGKLLSGAGIPLSPADFIVLEFNTHLPMEIRQGFAKEIKGI